MGEHHAGHNVLLLSSLFIPLPPRMARFSDSCQIKMFFKVCLFRSHTCCEPELMCSLLCVLQSWCFFVCWNPCISSMFTKKSSFWEKGRRFVGRYIHGVVQRAARAAICNWRFLNGLEKRKRNVYSLANANLQTSVCARFAHQFVCDMFRLRV